MSPVRDHYRRPVGADLGQRSLDVPLSLGVERRRGLVEKQSGVRGITGENLEPPEEGLTLPVSSPRPEG